jgi:hypothetical protein
MIGRTVVDGGAATAIDLSDIWGSTSESGWGITLAHQANTIFSAWYTYNAARQPVWYVSACRMAQVSTTAQCTGEVFRVTGGVPITSSWNGAALQTQSVGVLTLNFEDASTAAMTATIDGKASSKRIQRVLF